jgi:hypothetical protein
MTHTLNSDKSVAVAVDYYWLPIDNDTPHGAKLQLLGKGGVAIYGTYDGKATFFTHWAPLPRKPE